MLLASLTAQASVALKRYWQIKNFEMAHCVEVCNLLPTDAKELKFVVGRFPFSVGIFEIYPGVSLDINKEVFVLEFILAHALNQMNTHGPAVERPMYVEMHLEVLVTLWVVSER